MLSAILTMVLAVQPLGTVFAETTEAASGEPLEVLFEDDFEAEEIRADWEFASTGEYTLESDEQQNTWFRMKGIPWDAKAYVNNNLKDWQNYSVQMDFVINEWLEHGTGMEPYDCMGIVGKIQGNDKIPCITAELHKRWSSIKCMEMQDMSWHKHHTN